VPVARHLQLERRYRWVLDYLVQFDADLRLRKSTERPNLYVLERRLRNRPAANLGMRDLSDLHIQARDGYIHVATVHPSYLDRPWRMIEKLKESGADLWDRGGAGRIADECEYEEAWARLSRKRRRLQLFRDIAKDSYDILNRINSGGERPRLNNAGAPGPPTTEPSHDSVHQAAHGQQNG
jgi:hypothetical protein